MFAALTQHEGFFGEMNVIKDFATFSVTSHVALRQAVEMISPERITSAVRLADATLPEGQRHRPAAHRRRGAQPPQRRGRAVRRRGDPHHPPDRGPAYLRRRAMHRPGVVRRHLPEGAEGRLRRRRDDVPRPAVPSCWASTRASPSRPGSRPSSRRPRTAPRSISSGKARPTPVRWSRPCASPPAWRPRRCRQQPGIDAPGNAQTPKKD